MRPIEPPPPLSLTRRQLFRFLLGLAAWLPAPLLLAAVSGRPDRDGRALTVLVDLLLPADDVSPAASELGIDAAILAQSTGDGRFGRLVEAGLAYLDAEAGKAGAQAFAELDEDRQIGIVAEMERSRQYSTPRRFFEAVRGRAFSQYYADPRSWVSLGYEGPPQPRGFAGHDQPPRRSGQESAE